MSKAKELSELGDAVTVDSGNVGIGTSSPAKKLSVKSNGGGSQLGIDIHNEGTATGDDSVISFETQGSREFTMGLDRSATSFVIAEAGDLNSNQRLVINDSGNIGIKQSSPSSPNGSTDFLHIGNSASTYSSIVLEDNNNTWEIFQNNQLSFRDGTDTRLLIDTSGNVGIGESSPSAKLTVNVGSDGNSVYIDGNGTQLAIGSSSSVNYINSQNGSAALALQTNGSERMRIDSSGNVLVGVSAFANNTLGVAIRGASTGASDESIRCAVPSTGSTLQIGFYNANGRVGSVSTSGTSTAFNTSSDYRLKENVTYDWDATTRLKQLKPARFNFIADADTTVDGFLAHEVSSIVPEAIVGEKDAVDDEGNAVYQGIDQSKLVPLLVKTIQELEARITALEGN